MISRQIQTFGFVVNTLSFTVYFANASFFSAVFSFGSSCNVSPCIISPRFRILPISPANRLCPALWFYYTEKLPIVQDIKREKHPAPFARHFSLSYFRLRSISSAIAICCAGFPLRFAISACLRRSFARTDTLPFFPFGDILFRLPSIML